MGHRYVVWVLNPFYISASEEWEPFRLLRNKFLKPCIFIKFKISFIHAPLLVEHLYHSDCDNYILDYILNLRDFETPEYQARTHTPTHIPTPHASHSQVTFLSTPFQSLLAPHCWYSIHLWYVYLYFLIVLPFFCFNTISIEFNW